MGTYDLAQAFTTGGNAAGYTLTGVEVEFAGVAKVASYAVGIWSSDEEEDSGADTDSIHEPHEKLGDLTCPALSVSTDDAVYDCTTTGIDLEADTTYLFVVDSSDAAANYLRNTASDSEDAGAASGWSIANESIFRTRTPGLWSTWNESRKIRINGTAKSATNTAPTASNNTVTTAEDSDYRFTAANFNFSDTDTGDTLSSVKITTLPGSGKGSLELDGTAIGSSDLPQTVTRAQLDRGDLVYDPPSSGTGTGFASFMFKVNDGTDDSASAYTMTVDVTAAPVSSNVLVSNVGQSRSGSVTLQFYDAAQAFTTGHDPAGYRLTGVEVRFHAVPDASATYDVDIWSSDEEADSGADSDSRHEPHAKLADLTCGALAVGNVACTAAGTGFDLAADTTYLLVIDSSSNALNQIGVTNSGNEDAGAALGWSIEDTGLFRSRTSTGGWTESSTSRMIRVNGAAKSSGANTAPTAANGTVRTAVDTEYTFSASDFNFSDTDTGDTLASVRITTVESAGDLELDGRDVTRNQVIGKRDIDDGDLTFAPASGDSGTGYATFQFKVSDGRAESASAYTMTVDVTAASSRAPGSSLRVTPRLTGVAVAGAGSGRFRLSWDKLPAGVERVHFSIGLGVNSNPNHWVIRQRPDGGYEYAETTNQTFWDTGPLSGTPTAGQSFAVPAGESPTSATFPCSRVEYATHPNVRYRVNHDYGSISPHLYLLLRARAHFSDGRFEPWTYPVYFRGCGVDPGRQMTSRFLNPNEPHDGSTPFDAKLELSLEPASGFSYRVFQGDRHRGRPSALQVTNGTVQRARRDGAGQNRKWLVTIQPTSDEAVTITLPATTDCTDVNAICTADGIMLSEAVTKVVPGPATETETPTETQTEPSPLTVAYTTAPPAEHDGESAFSFAFSFSENLASGFSYRTIRDHALRVVQGGTRLVPKASRKVGGAGNDRHWVVTVTPDGHADIRVNLSSGAACGTDHAICTADERALSNGLSATVQGPPGLSVAGARVEEAAGATVDFAVTLSRASASRVTVDYATSDGTAAAGSDYTATSGTLTFAAGETEKTVSVPVLDDDHDEDEESFTLTLSNASGGNAYLKDAAATGTIENSDAMPRAWLARFGRTVAEQAIEAVEGRFSASRTAGVEMTLAGERVGLSGGGVEPEEREARSRLEAVSAWLRGTEEADDRRAGFGARAVTPRELLTGSSFALTGEATAGGTVSLWGRGAVSRFDGRDGELTLDGEVVSAMLGADWARERWTAGLLLSRSKGEGSYRGASAGTVESALTGFFPYGRYKANSRVTLWGIAGYGAGELTLTPNEQAPMRTDTDLAMGAIGLRGVAVEAGPQGGLELAVKSDAMAVRTASEKTRGLAAAEAEATRLRLGLEGTYRGLRLGTGRLAPTLEIGVRHDGGDAETGFGLDLGGGLSWSDPESGLAAELRGRGLLTHESKGFRDRGISGSLGWDPRPETRRGPSLSLTRTLGAAASGGADALLGQRHLGGLAAHGNDNGNDLDDRRLELRMGYGFAVLADRFTLTPEAGLGLASGHREYRLGWRLGLEHGGPVSMELGLEGRRREAAAVDEIALGWRLGLAPGGPGALDLEVEATRSAAANDNAEYGIGFRVTARW